MMLFYREEEDYLTSLTSCLYPLSCGIEYTYRARLLNLAEIDYLRSSTLLLVTVAASSK